MYPSAKKDDDFNFKLVLQRFLALAMYPFGLKEGAPLVMYPLITFP